MDLRPILALGTAVALLAACETQLTEPTGSPSFARVDNAVTCHTITFDDLGLGHGDRVMSIPTPLGFDLSVSVTPGSALSAPYGILYDTNTDGGPDPDLEASRDCPACDGLDNILVIEPSVGFAVEGDSYGGGTVTLTGFPTSGTAYIERYVAVDQESVEAAIQLYIDGTLVGQSSGQGDGSVEDVLASSPNIDEKAEFVWGGSGGVDNIKVCAGEAPLGRMTGGGNQLTIIDGVEVKVSRGFTIHCDIALSNNVEVNWDGNRWHIDKPLTRATCLDDPAIDPTQPAAPFDTFIGEGVGRLNGVDGSTIRFTFVDSGEPGGRNDSASIRIWAPGDDPDVDVPVLEVTGDLEKGNLQAHYDQPHGSNWNK